MQRQFLITLYVKVTWHNSANLAATTGLAIANLDVKPTEHNTKVWVLPSLWVSSEAKVENYHPIEFTLQLVCWEFAQGRQLLSQDIYLSCCNSSLKRHFQTSQRLFMMDWGNCTLKFPPIMQPRSHYGCHHCYTHKTQVKHIQFKFMRQDLEFVKM